MQPDTDRDTDRASFDCPCQQLGILIEYYAYAAWHSKREKEREGNAADREAKKFEPAVTEMNT